MDVIPADWYKNWFGNEYLTVYAHRDEAEAKDLIQLIYSATQIKPRSRIMDLCCGQGRHAVLLAEQGYDVVGVDLSRTLLEIAKFRMDLTQRANFVQADMRFLPASLSFDLVLNLFTSFGYFEDDEENLAVFREFNTVLKNGGYFVFDYLNTDHVIANLVPEHSDKIGKYHILTERRIHEDKVQKKITIVYNNDTSVFYESVKMYQADQIYRMLEQAGLAIRNVFGDYQGNDFGPDMPRLLIIGQKSN